MSYNSWPQRRGPPSAQPYATRATGNVPCRHAQPGRQRHRTTRHISLEHFLTSQSPPSRHTHRLVNHDCPSPDCRHRALRDPAPRHSCVSSIEVVDAAFVGPLRPPESRANLYRGMNVAAGPKLAAAVSNAGGLGVIGGIGELISQRPQADAQATPPRSSVRSSRSSRPTSPTPSSVSPQSWPRVSPANT